MRALVIAALLLLAALATSPAYAQDVGTTTPPTTTDPSSTPPTPSDTTPPAEAPATPPDPSSGTPPADTTPPPSDQPATPPDTPPSDSSSPPATSDPSAPDTSHKQPARPADEFTTSTPASSPSATTPSSSGSGAAKDTPPSGTSGHSDSWLGQDTFVIDKRTAKDHVGLKTVRRRFAGLFLLGASTKATRIEAKVRRAHETAKISPIGSGTPVPGSPLPSQNPFFNLMSGPGGIAAGLMLASMFAVLGTALVLPRDRLTAFRTPSVTWRPLAYVPPIELPG